MGIPVWGLILLAAPVFLHAQQSADLPGKPRANNSESDSSTANKSRRNTSAENIQTLSFGERLKIYEHSFTNPESMFGPLMGAGISQLRDTPPEWGQGAIGYGRRVASGYARNVIGRTIAPGSFHG